MLDSGQVWRYFSGDFAKDERLYLLIKGETIRGHRRWHAWLLHGRGAQTTWLSTENFVDTSWSRVA